jgi:hypothetical protein
MPLTDESADLESNSVVVRTEGADMTERSFRTEPTAASAGGSPAMVCMGRWRIPWTGRGTMALFALFVVPLALSRSACGAPPATQPPTAQPQAAQLSDVIQTQDANVDGVVAELTGCRRSEGVLTIKVRFRNNSDKQKHLDFTHWNATAFDNPKFYVTAGNKKYFLLADSDGTVLSTNSTGNGVDATLDPGKTFLWWGKYPAPPADVKKINFMMPVATPFDDIPISDK